jgi:hypothetical protein
MFSDENDFRENDYFFLFFVFGCIPENALENILQCYAKDRAEGAGVRCAFLENGLRKNWA